MQCLECKIAFYVERVVKIFQILGTVPIAILRKLQHCLNQCATPQRRPRTDPSKSLLHNERLMQRTYACKQLCTDDTDEIHPVSIFTVSTSSIDFTCLCLPLPVDPDLFLNPFRHFVKSTLHCVLRKFSSMTLIESKNFMCYIKVS